MFNFMCFDSNYFTIKYSYSIDLQPQGRYIMSILIPIALFMSIGYEYFSEFIEIKYK